MLRIFNRIKFDLHEIPGDIIEMVRGWWDLLLNPKKAPPSVRTPDLGFVTILDKEGKVVGCFVPHLYEMAKNKLLRCQREINDKDADTNKHRKKPPYITLKTPGPNGREKTPFELALLPVEYSEEDEASQSRLRKIVEDEFYHLKQKGISLPPEKFKYLIASDYLKNLEEATGLKVGKPSHTKMSLQNPHDKATLQERIFHYIAQRSALLLTLAAAILIIPVITNSAYFPVAIFGVPIVPIAILGIVLTQWCSKEFSTYELAETAMRHINAFSYSRSDKISVKKSLKTILLMGALLTVAGAAGVGAWFEMMSFAWPTATSAVLAKLLTASHFFLAGFVASFAAIGVFVGGAVSQDYYWGLGPRYLQIDFTNIETTISKEKPLAPLTERQVLSPAQTEYKILKWRYDCLHRHNNLDNTQVEKVRQAFELLAEALAPQPHNSDMRTPSPPTLR